MSKGKITIWLFCCLSPHLVSLMFMQSLRIAKTTLSHRGREKRCLKNKIKIAFFNFSLLNTNVSECNFRA